MKMACFHDNLKANDISTSYLAHNVYGTGSDNDLIRFGDKRSEVMKVKTII